ncbi:MAG: DUF5060 domain-containing protein, partial [Planctomycetota bacterium]
MSSRIFLLVSAVALTALLLSCRIVPEDRVYSARSGDLGVEYWQNTNTVPLFEVFEITFRHDRAYKNPFSDVTIDVTLTSPAGKKVRVGGFHYGSLLPPTIGSEISQTARGERQKISYRFEKQDLWKARFAPSQLGKWKYSFVLENANGQKAYGRGSFTCVEGRSPKAGFIRQHPENPFRFVFDDGSAYFPIGLQDCWGDNSATGSALDQCSMEGPFRTDRPDAPELPEGPMFVRGASNNPQNADVYFRY